MALWENMKFKHIRMKEKVEKVEKAYFGCKSGIPLTPE